MSSRTLLSILLLFFCGLANAQYKTPIGQANVYTLTGKDGFPGNDYVGGLEYTPSGLIYAKDFFGDFSIIGNNFTRQIPGLENLSNNTHLYVVSDSGAWLLSESMRLIVIKNGRIWGTIAPPAKDFLQVKPDTPGDLYGVEQMQGKLVIYRFREYTWEKLYEIPFHLNAQNKLGMVTLLKNGAALINITLPGGSQRIYETDTSRSRVKYLTSVPNLSNMNFFVSIHDAYWKEKKALIQSFRDFMQRRIPSTKPISLKDLADHFSEGLLPQGFIFFYGNGYYEYFTMDNDRINPHTILFYTKDKLYGINFNKVFPYLTIATEGKPFRVFSYIKKYPQVFNNDNSENIFALGQDDKGRIWAGSYQNQLSIIQDPLDPNQTSKIIRLKKQPYPFMNAELDYNGNMYLVGEYGDGGLMRYNMNGEGKKVPPQTETGYYLYLAPKGQTVYYPVFDPPTYPVYYCKADELEKSFIHWEKLDTTSGILPFGMATMTEDTMGRIWMGHPKKGFAVYNPETHRGITYQTSKRQTPIGFISSLTDNRGTVWMGSDNHGLWYYDNYHKAPDPENIHQVSHPLLNHVKRITSMAIYKDWLVLGCYDRICLLNLDSFYQRKKIILRYLNPQEAALTGYTEQNTMLVSKTDGALWFATSDMLYRWDINTWLHLPVYKVSVNTYIKEQNDKRIKLSAQKELKLPASVHGFDLVFEYLSPDALPRFTRTALVRNGDSIHYSEPGMESRFSFMNLSGGHYTFYLEIFEQDGTTSHYEYAFFISKHLWQYWWFWTAVTLLFLLPFILWFNTIRLKALKEKEISQMNLVTLSAQFRPHFILNALNAIGADLKGNHEAESIISRLGESINLIFRHAQSQKISHSLKEEWLLVSNVIEIHRIIYLPELQVSIEGEYLLKEFEALEVPLGILEIHVENALLHGLRNKSVPPYILSVYITEDNENLYFVVADNGIGRAEARTISSYKKNGVGTKNLNNIIKTLNKYNKRKIDITYTDIPKSKGSGTIVKITIPKDYFFKY